MCTRAYLISKFIDSIHKTCLSQSTWCILNPSSWLSSTEWYTHHTHLSSEMIMMVVMVVVMMVLVMLVIVIHDVCMNE
jgi:hypothetical protein